MVILHVPVLGFAAFSGTGKTTLLSKLIPLLKAEGLCIGLIKHSHHHFQIDKPGKDSYRHRKAGASPVMISSRYRRAMIWERGDSKEPSLFEELRYFDQSGLDIILVEGFKREPFAKIELHRPSLSKPLLFQEDDSIIAIACDEILSSHTTLPVLDLNQPAQIADFIVNRFLPNESH